MRQIPGPDPAIEERAHPTDRQRECLDLQLRGTSYRYSAREIGVHGLLSGLKLSRHSFAQDVRQLDDRVQLDPVVRYVARVLEVEESDPLHGGGAVEHPICSGCA